VLILEGAAESPVYLEISGNGAVIKAADELWGLKTGVCEEILKKQAKGRVGVACIGPAGENQVIYSGLFCNGRAAGRGGIGAVLGAKNVKAIIAGGSDRAPVGDEPAFKTLLQQAITEVMANKVTSDTFRKFGSGSMVNFTNVFGIMPHRNFQEAALPDAQLISGETLREGYLVRDKRCSIPCIVKCSKIYAAKGDYEGWEAEGPEYESIYSLGSGCGIYEPSFIIAADKLCDDLGLDTISAGMSIAFAMECFEKGILNTKDTDGCELRFGNHKEAFELLEKIAYKEGFGSFLALGTKQMSDKLGQNTEAFAMHAKGMELGGYDPRGMLAQALVYACGPRGGCHHSGGFPVFSEILGKKDLFAIEGKAEVVKATRDKRISMSDSPVLCTFTTVGITDQTLARLVSAVVGRDLEPAWFLDLGDRASTVERAFNVREGLRREDDTLPDRILSETVPSGPSRGRTVDLEPLLDNFYRLCGWDLKTGIPLPEKMRGAGLTSTPRV